MTDGSSKLLKLAAVNHMKSAILDVVDDALERIYCKSTDTYSPPLRHVDSMELLSDRLDLDAQEEPVSRSESPAMFRPSKRQEACSLPHVDSVELLSKLVAQEEEEERLHNHVPDMHACTRWHSQWMFGVDQPPSVHSDV
eukprot:CAMPEP_0206235844 /NCGR_PEP_ID=MMETSP0047_2-20121206/13383_1 /ASSEMBLY_ACC=CAM_ASM_000192 /TAXON_ID=195065 /ORGANISM="Chroomonas mesostigmatica_cf, Strain CCMP1168" /LENGTH=139 /DNA_ID=CAMNT_0053660109 /DNA_START=221 /DNA_END=640 /DNA_ORIENTATION=+